MQQAINPGEEVGTQLQSGLNFIFKSLRANPSIDDLTNAVYGHIKTAYYPVENRLSSKQIEIEIKTVAQTAIINFINSPVLSRPPYDGDLAKLSPLIAALTITAGKMLFNWTPKQRLRLTLNLQTIVNLNSFSKNKEIVDRSANDTGLLLRELRVSD